jgi:hypothetical protein
LVAQEYDTNNKIISIRISICFFLMGLTNRKKVPCNDSITEEGKVYYKNTVVYEYEVPLKNGAR